MTPMRPLCGFAIAFLALGGGLLPSQSAKAEDPVDFLWGGGDDYGGGRSVVSFDPQYKPNQIIVSFSDRRLYLITRPGQAITYPVAVPKGEARWQGVTFVSNKKVNPAWTPTPEMVRNNPRLPTWVPGGHPMNPLGIRAMYLGSSAYRIHGTDAPWTIGQAVSHGCIRMINQDVLDLYPRVPIGMRVTVTWQRFSTRAVASNDASYASYSTDASSVSSGSGSSYVSNNGAGYGPYRGGANGYNAYDSNDSTPSPSNTRGRAASKRPDNGSIGSPSFSDNDPAPAPASAAATSSAPAPTKKKAATASLTKKKQESEEAAAPSAAPVSRSVPDPVKPHNNAPTDPAASKSSTSEKASAPELVPAATKASASATEGLSVQKATAQVQ